MRVSWVTIYVGLATAQTFQGLPSCATSCLTSFESGSSIAGCNSLDIACICSNQSFLGSIACCLAASCSADDQKAATQYALNLCKTNGITTLPTSVSCTSTASSGSESPATALTSSTPTANAASTTGNTSSSSNTAAATQTHNAAQQRVPGFGAGLGLAAVAVFL